MDLEHTYCRWAEAKYGLAEVERVSFETVNLSNCETCGDDVCVLVTVHTPHQPRGREFEERYAGDLISDILRFAVDAPLSGERT